ncbi:MAG: DNA internalization-related competence protein ComEC/Rec2 [Bacteroidota bacterium]|nr:DNA internalization-related competence protein ComEC/Rec2 [Bacteroidota bacterium]
MFSTKPAIKFVLPLIAGILIGWEFSFSIWYLLGFLVFLFTLSVLIFYYHKDNSLIYTFIIVSLLFTLGVFKITIDGKFIPDNQISKFVATSGIQSIEGIITDPPQKKTYNIQFVIESEKIKSEKDSIGVFGGVLVSIPRENISDQFSDSLEYGVRVTLSGQLALAGTARNPGEFDLRRYLEVNDIYARIYLDGREDVVIQQKTGNWFLSYIIYPLRKKIAHNFDRFVGGEEAKFLKGILVGDRSEIPFETKEAFINSGVMHILAVSGLHVGMIILIVISLLTAFRIPEKLKIITTCFILISFVFLTGQSPSVVRASVMGVILLSSLLLERKIDIFNSLAVAAIILLFFDAKQLFHPGFQLSFAAVISIVLLYPKISSVDKLIPQNIRNVSSVKFIIGLAAVSVSAAIGTLPFTSYYFGKISMIGLVANLLVVPLTGIVLALGITTTVFSFVSSWLGLIFAETTKSVAGLLLHLVAVFGNWKYSFIYSNFTLFSGLLFYGSIIFLFTINRKVFFKRSIFVLLIVSNIILYYFIFFKVEPKLKTTFIDVGQGDAIFLEFPNGKNMLVDGGARTFYRDAGQRFITPFLNRQGISQIDILVNSHPHHDHLGGFPYLMRNFKIGKIIDAGSFEKSDIFKEFKHIIDSSKINYQIIKRGEIINVADNFRIYVLHPSEQYDSTDIHDLNNQSLVLKVVYGKTELILTGDAERATEIKLINQYKEFLEVDILKCGHHGSTTSSSLEFIETIKPSLSVISVGYANKFNHPSKIVLENLKRMNIKIYRTDLQGAIVLESNGLTWREVEWR